MTKPTYYRYTCRVCKATCPHLVRVVANDMPPNLVCVECTSCGILGIMMISKAEVWAVILIHNLPVDNFLPVDNSIRHAQNVRISRSKLSTPLTAMIASIRNAEPRREIAQAVAVMLLGGLCLFPNRAHAVEENVTKYKAYAATKANSPLEFYSMLILYENESNWRTKAVSGTHFGICQGKSKFLKNANYIQQIDWCYRYSINRYGSMLEALKHWQVYGWH